MDKEIFFKKVNIGDSIQVSIPNRYNYNLPYYYWGTVEELEDTYLTIRDKKDREIILEYNIITSIIPSGQGSRDE